MRLIRLEHRRFSVCALADNGPEDGESCPTLAFLRTVPPHMAGSAEGFKALFKRFAEGGRQALTAELFHEADKTEEIWQFIKGRLRLLCFMDGGQLVVLSHGYIKRSQKADRKEVAVAIAAKKRYLEAKAARAIQTITRE